MIEHESAVLDCLHQARRRDTEKGGGGVRSTADVAEWTGTSTPTARRILGRLRVRGLVKCLDDERPLLWSVVGPTPAPGSEPAPEPGA